MCDICHEGGQVLGPFLKPMTHLVHTEYLLAGRTRSDVRDVLRDTMFAATVTGSPVENACRLIKRVRVRGARLLRRRPRPDRPRRAGRTRPRTRPIVIRTRRRLPGRRAEGDRRRDAGARLRPRLRGGRDARQGRRHPQRLRPRARGVGGARERRRAHPRRGRADRADLAQPAALQVLAHRPVRRRARSEELKGRSVAIVLDGEDDFVNMLRHVFSVLGMTLDGGPPRGLPARRRLRRLRPGRRRPRARRPARRRPPQDRGVPARRSTRSSRPASRSSRCAWATRCCATGSGSPWPTRTSSSRAPSRRSTSTGAQERVGFYNTFVARSGRPAARGRAGRADPATGDIHLVAGPHYRGVQFHAESILTENGFAAAPRPAAGPPGTRRWLNPGSSWSTTTTPTPGTSSTSSPSVTGDLPDVVEHDRGGASTSCDGYTPRRALARARAPGRRARLRPRPRRPRAVGVPVLGVCLGMQALVTAYGGRWQRVAAGPRRGRGRAARRRAGCSPACPTPFEAVRYHSLAAVERARRARA